MKHIILASHDPHYNLALEECLFKNLPKNHRGWFLLWRNSPAIIIGRHQIAENEVNLSLARMRKIPVLRRITGGGAVYHDLGNLNFSFIANLCPGQSADFRLYLEPICKALHGLGLNVQVSGRNDILIDGKKISGSGQARSENKILHHGTLLINVNFDSLACLLTPDKTKMQKHGVHSTQARVANLAQFWKGNLEELSQALVLACAPEPGSVPSEIEEMAQKLSREKYASREWNYDFPIKFNKIKKGNFPWGTVNLYLQIVNEKIEKCRIRGDFFSNGDIDALEQRISNRGPHDLAQALADINWEILFYDCQPDTMRSFFMNGIFDN